MKKAENIEYVPEQDINSLLEAALLQGPMICAINTVACNGHEMAATCHGLAQNRQVPVVHIRSIELDYTSHFLYDSKGDFSHHDYN